MTVGILGLGLIGGSMARAYAKAGHTVLAAEKDEMILSFAHLAGAVTDVLTDTTIGQCDLILLAIYPAGCATWLSDHAHLIRKDTLVMDLCGIKRDICEKCMPLADQYGFTFVGGHPMAGSHHSGFKYSRSNLFQGAPMVLVPPRYDDMDLLNQIKNVLEPCRFGSFSVTTAHDHDRMIAFTSQMAHVVSNAYIKSPTALEHRGFSAGSYKDLTRVAWLNSQMWAELCMENKDHMLSELNFLIENLKQYQVALQEDNLQFLTQLFEDGKRQKELVDG